jgi:hypothetical protein
MRTYPRHIANVTASAHDRDATCDQAGQLGRTLVTSCRVPTVTATRCRRQRPPVAATRCWRSRLVTSGCWRAVGRIHGRGSHRRRAAGRGEHALYDTGVSVCRAGQKTPASSGIRLHGNQCSRQHRVGHGCCNKLSTTEGAGLKIKQRAKGHRRRLISSRCHWPVCCVRTIEGRRPWAARALERVASMAGPVDEPRGSKYYVAG